MSVPFFPKGMKIRIGDFKRIPNRIDVELRDSIANERREIGHFEIDSVESCRKRGKNRSCLTVIVDRMSTEEIAYVEDWINNRPMKILGYKTPNEVFQLYCVAISS